MKILIRNGRVLDPATKTDEVRDILIADRLIEKNGGSIDEKEADRVIDAAGCFVMPGLIDLHVHFRDPGFEYKEDIESGCRAAVRGGYTTVCTMPNTKPVTDCGEVVTYIIEKAKKAGLLNVLPVGAVTKGQQGKEVTDIEEMKAAGICAISEDGKSVMDSNVYREAMKEAARLGLPVFAHCEDINLVAGGTMNMGKKSEEMGQKGISNAVEDIIASRDILLAKETGARLHLCHCSTEDSVIMVREAKAAGLPVTGEICPHHFTLCEEDIDSNDGNYKMNPPVRARRDLLALRQGLKDDVFDVISTDHAPHSEEEKSRGFEKSPFGIVGSETAVPLAITELVEKGVLTPMQMAEKMSYHSAQILGIDKGTLQEGKIADITIINPAEEYVIDKNTFASKGKNTPFDGWKVRGKVKYTIVNGKIVYQD